MACLYKIHHPALIKGGSPSETYVVSKDADTLIKYIQRLGMVLSNIKIEFIAHEVYVDKDGLE